MNCYLYILTNDKNKYYVGITQLLLEERLRRHNGGHVYSTRYGRPWEILYREEHKSIKKARQKEKQIKSWHGGNAFKKFITTAGESSNGRTAGFGPVNLGSNPGSPAVAMKKKNLAG